MYKLLVIGKLPPPIGGVTIHVSRLKDHLKKSNISNKFIELRSENLLKIFISILKFRVVHIHTSNVWLRFVVSIYSCFLNNILILTYHGNLGRYNKFLNWFDYQSVRFTSVPIVLNRESFQKAKAYNNNVKLVPAFIPPLNYSSTEESLLNEKIKTLKYKYTRVYCTNASTVSFDKKGNEIYGITSLIKLFSTLENFGLIVSDSSGKYFKYLKEKNVNIGNNITLINFHHSFYTIIKNTDGFIRSTTTDGDSLSVKEALYLGKNVYCSDCVDRPNGVILFQTHNYEQLKKLLLDEVYYINNKKNVNVENGFNKLKKIYQNNN